MPPERGASRARPNDPPAAALQALVEGTDEGMMLADGTAVIQYANPASEVLLGYSPAELRGRVGFDMCQPEHVPLARAAMVYGLAKQQGGFVDVQSAPGQGTNVSLFFPRVAVPK